MTGVELAIASRAWGWSGSQSIFGPALGPDPDGALVTCPADVTAAPHADQAPPVSAHAPIEDIGGQVGIRRKRTCI